MDGCNDSTIGSHLWTILGDLPKGHISGLIRLKARRINAPHQKSKDERYWEECNHRNSDKGEDIPNSKQEWYSK